MKTIKQQFEEITLIKVFEIPVIDKRNNTSCHVLFNVAYDDKNNRLVAQHESLSDEQAKSDKIAFVYVSVDDDFSLEIHLAELYEECFSAIEESEYFAPTEHEYPDYRN
jgi:hypothetical protein